MSERSEYSSGEFCWVDLATTDVEGATRFYGELLGIDAEAAPGDPEETGGYGFFTKGGKMVAGIGPTQRDDQPSAWSSYIRVEDADASAEKAKEAGGQRRLWADRHPQRVRADGGPSGPDRRLHLDLPAG